MSAAPTKTNLPPPVDAGGGEASHRGKGRKGTGYRAVRGTETVNNRLSIRGEISSQPPPPWVFDSRRLFYRLSRERLTPRAQARTEIDPVHLSVCTLSNHPSSVGSYLIWQDARPPPRCPLTQPCVLVILFDFFLSLSYIYDPTAPAEVRKADSAGSSLYQPHHLPGAPPSSDPQKQGYNNLGYSKSSDSTLKLEVDNNHVNRRLHAAPPPAEVYIIQPEKTRWMVEERSPSPVPVYPNMAYRDHSSYDQRPSPSGWDHAVTECVNGVDEIDEGVGGTPEYLCDTGDEVSVLSVDIHTSNTSLSSADTRDGLRLPKTPDVSTVESGISVMKSEDEEEATREEVQSVTDSMVAEALAALEAATAGEDFE